MLSFRESEFLHQCFKKCCCDITILCSLKLCHVSAWIHTYRDSRLGELRMGPSKYIQSQFYTPGLLPFEGDLFTLFCAFALNARSGKVTEKTWPWRAPSGPKVQPSLNSTQVRQPAWKQVPIYQCSYTLLKSKIHDVWNARALSPNPFPQLTKSHP